MEAADVAALDEIALAERFHWTIDYIRSMDELDKLRLWAILDGRAKASELITERNRPKRTQ
jgi:hypothetical protein